MDKSLSWFLGPKSENENEFKKAAELIIEDYLHWRRNYFPKDALLINKSDQREAEIQQEYDSFFKQLHILLAELSVTSLL